MKKNKILIIFIITILIFNQQNAYAINWSQIPNYLSRTFSKLKKFPNKIPNKIQSKLIRINEAAVKLIVEFNNAKFIAANTDDINRFLNSKDLYRLIEPTFSLLTIIPENEKQIKYVFDVTPTQKTLVEMEKSRQFFEKLNLSNFYKGAYNFDDFINYLKTDKSNFLFIVGHNNKGILRLLDSKDELSKLAESCGQYKKYCIFLSCNSESWIKSSNSITINTEITYEQAAKIVKSTIEHFKNTKLTSFVDTQFFISSTVYLEEMKVEVKLAVRGGSVVGIIIVVGVLAA